MSFIDLYPANWAAAYNNYSLVKQRNY